VKRGPRLAWQVFLSILVVTLLSVLATGLAVRAALSGRFEDYVTGMHGQPGMGRGMGRMMLGAAEQTFLDSVDQAIFVSALLAIAAAALAALLLAKLLARPLGSLTVGARRFASGDHDVRVDVDGPVEVVDLAVAFNEMADSLAEAETLRRRLVADVAHELRNPIASLRAQTEAVAEGVLELDEARARSLVADISHLSRLVDDLQELSLAEAGQLRYERTDLDLADLVDEELERARALAQPGVTLRREGAGGPVCADPDRVGQVVRNLLSNALRHTEQGSVVVAVAPNASGGARVEVRDTGVGIPAADLPYVFERFYRADTSRAGVTGGAGIGLAIAARIIEDHGGHMFADSDPGVMTVVGFEIPGAETGPRQSGGVGA